MPSALRAPAPPSRERYGQLQQILNRAYGSDSKLKSLFEACKMEGNATKSEWNWMESMVMHGVLMCFESFGATEAVLSMGLQD